MEKNDQRNFFFAMIAMVVILFAWQSFVIDPQVKKRKEAEAAQQARIEADAGLAPASTPATSGEAEGEGEADDTLAVPVPAASVDVEEAILKDPRIRFEGGSFDGSIRLSGARIDDVSLKTHYLTVEKKAEVRLLRPEAADYSYYAFIGWTDASGGLIAGANADWKLVSGSVLTPESPVTLALDKDGVRIERRISIDEDYMFTFADTVTNTGSAEMVVRPVSAIRRFGDWKGAVDAVEPGSSRATSIVHQGLIGVLDGKLDKQTYRKFQKGKRPPGGLSTEGGWFGFTDKYWMTTIVPEQSRAFEVRSSTRVRDGRRISEITTLGEEMSLSPGASMTVTNRVFAGAKELDVLKAYEKDLSIPRFNDAVDWGRFYFLTKPFFWLLTLFKGWVSGLGPVSFGVAILLLTVSVKLVFFPIQMRAYASMSKMKKLSEPMKEIRERFAADKQRQQQEILKLYQREKVNPLSGCLPMLIQIPVFFALYKTLYVTIEMRHAPFFGWVNDLSAPDPTAIGNLFGLLGGIISTESIKSIPFIGGILGIGVWPILYGLTMWGVQSLNPPPPDAMQRRIFAFLPLVFTFVFGGFAVGLVIYWVWSNFLTLIQQYIIMRRQGVETQFDKLYAKWFGKKTGESPQG